VTAKRFEHLDAPELREIIERQAHTIAFLRQRDYDQVVDIVALRLVLERIDLDDSHIAALTDSEWEQIHALVQTFLMKPEANKVSE